MLASEFAGRKAPYAPISALREFFERIRGVSVPSRVDRRFLQKLGVASNNEWSLLSALKFLGIVDADGVPTLAYVRLQSSDQFEETLGSLVLQAYKALIEQGGLTMSEERLRNYFRMASSASQAKNAARFFREVCILAKLEGSPAERPPAVASAPEPELHGDQGGDTGLPHPVDNSLLRARVELLSKLPPPRPEWTAEEYRAICELFSRMLDSLEPS